MVPTITMGIDATTRRSPWHVWRRDTGMVSLEFAVVTMATAWVFAVLVWLVAVLSWQMRIHDIAWESARQVARGQSWAAVVEATASRDASIVVSMTQDDTRVTVTAARMVRAPGVLPDLTVDAAVTTMVEP